jgi:hypothetical protein
MATRAIDWLFRSRETGRITVAQFPNPALWLFLATVVAARVTAPAATARTVIDGVGAAALGWWALDEVIRGVNPWRRLLGLAGCVLVVSRVVPLGRL